MSEVDYRQRLIVAREAMGLSQREMAERLLTPRQTYEQWESGTRRTPGVAIVAAEAAARSIALTWPSMTRREQLETVERLADGTRSRQEVATMLAISASQLAYAHAQLLGLGASPRFRNGRLPPRKSRRRKYSARVVAFLDGTLTAQEVADRCGVTRSAVYGAASAAQERGEVVAFRRERAAFTRPDLRTISQRIAALADGSRTGRQIADALGVKISAVYATISRLRQRRVVVPRLPRLTSTRKASRGQ